MNRAVGWLVVTAFLLVWPAGCKHATPGPPCPPPGPGGPFMPGTPQPLPPQPFPPTQPQPIAPQPVNPLIPPPPVPVVPQQTSAYNPLPRDLPQWRPGEVTVQLGAPQVIVGADALPTNPMQQADAKQVQTSAKANKSPAQPATFPVGIPQFAVVHANVSSGLRPMLDDGLDWLKDNGYRTVVYLREPGATDAADRKQVEKRGMIFMSLEVAPEKLTKKVVEEFNKLVVDTGAQPVFVYDRDGALAGSLWYLHFRTAEGASADEARVRAAALGLRVEKAGLHQDMWNGARQLMGE